RLRVLRLLSGYTLKYPPGTHYEYANVGFGLLGHALARRAGKSYDALLAERVCDPLGLHSTRIVPTADMRSRLAHGHDRRLVPTPLSDNIRTLAGAYAAKSTANEAASPSTAGLPMAMPDAILPPASTSTAEGVPLTSRARPAAKLWSSSTGERKPWARF